MKPSFLAHILAGILASGFLVLFPDASQQGEVRDVANLPTKVSKARIMKLKSQLIARPKTKLGDQEDTQTADPELDDVDLN